MTPAQTPEERLQEYPATESESLLPGVFGPSGTGLPIGRGYHASQKVQASSVIHHAILCQLLY